MAEMREQLQAILEQEERLRLKEFGHDEAWRLGNRLIGVARSSGLAVATTVTLGDQVAFHAALRGTSPDNDAWLRRKVATVRRFLHASWSLELQAQSGVDLHRILGTAPADYAFAGGAFPLRVGECLVGVAAVSGLSGAEDHSLVVQVLEELL